MCWQPFLSRDLSGESLSLMFPIAHRLIAGCVRTALVLNTIDVFEQKPRVKLLSNLVVSATVDGRPDPLPD